VKRIYKNIFGADLTKDVLLPVAGGTVGFLAARYAGNMLAARGLGTSNPNTAKLIAAGVGIPAVFMLARKSPGGMVARNSGMLALGMGMAVAEGYLRDTPLLGGSRAATVLPGVLPPGPTPESVSGLAAYYDYPVNAEGQALSDDYYTAGMLGSTGDPGDQGAVENAIDQMESVSTVIPTDLALKAQSMPQFAPVAERFSNRGDRGHAGGVFARHLFSGMTGS